jgi:FO synthase
MTRLEELGARRVTGGRLSNDEARELARLAPESPGTVVRLAGALRDRLTGPKITYSRKVFIPLTKLCRDACGYCTFAHPPVAGERAFLTIEEVLDIARAGEAAGCREALFTLGDKPERKWRQARAELAAMGCASTIEYLIEACAAVLEHTTLLPHTNPGTISVDEALALKRVSISQGMMLETISERLLKRGMAHFGAPDKKPGVRLATLEAPPASSSESANMPRSASMHCSRSGTLTSDTVTSKRSSSRTLGRSHTRSWPTRPNSTLLRSG